MSSGPDSQPRTVIDPTTGRPILMAPQRQQRPMHTGPQAKASDCPFCQGNEAETPPETAAVRSVASPANGPGWSVRAFPNKYPANAHHEVLAEGQAHREHPAELDAATWRQCVGLWQRRVAAIEARPGVRCAYLFKNVGSLAGASIAHNHSQILGLPELPPRLALEQTTASALARCPWCTSIAGAERDQRIVYAAARHVVLCPDPPKLPYETWLLPTRCDDDFLTTDLDSLSEALLALFVAVDGSLKRPSFNLWLHRIPGAPFHWHFELQPRTGQMAGLELGGDMYINSLPAAAAAAKLRTGLTAR